MVKRTLLFAFVASLWACTTSAQIGPPQQPGNHADRFEQLKCALVLIKAEGESGQRLGTGFYINADGDIATAAHVLGDVGGWRTADKQVHIRLPLPHSLYITNSKGEEISIPPAIEDNPDAWLADVARIRTGKATNCWLREGDDQKIVPGTHLLTMGFPGLHFNVLTMYTGMMTARLPPTSNPPILILDTGERVWPPNEFIRVQMPLSAGLSGAPIIDDENRVLAVVHGGGLWTPDQLKVLQDFQNGNFTPDPKANRQQQDIIHLYALMGELLRELRSYASPGYGDAVPLRYLRKTSQQSPPPASHDR